MQPYPIRRYLGRFAALMALGTLTVPATLVAQGGKRPTTILDSDEPGRVPYAKTASAVCSNLAPRRCTFTWDPVPAGKRLVVEHVSALVETGSVNVTLDHLALTTSDPSTAGPVLQWFAMSQVSIAKFMMNDPALAYVEAGQSPQAVTPFQNSSDTIVGYATITGYLVDLLAGE